MPGGLLDLYSVGDRLEMMEGLRVMEAAALTELAKENKDGA